MKNIIIGSICLAFASLGYADEAVSVNKHANHHKSESATSKHLKKHAKSIIAAHRHDHQGNADIANAHASKHNNSHLQAHLHDHQNIDAEANAHNHDHHQ